MANVEYSRLLMKRSLTSGVVPTIPLTNNLNDFTTTDIFEGELFYNVADGILYSRDLTGIVILASGVVPPPPPNLTTVLSIGNNTGPFDIVLDTDQKIINPPALSPLESYLSLGTTSENNAVDLRSLNSTTGTASGLRLREVLGIREYDVQVNDGAGNFALSTLTTDSLGGFTFMSAGDISGSFITHNVTAIGGFHGFNCGNPTGQALVWNQQPTQYDWTINDPIANNTVTEVNDFLTGSRRDVTSATTTNYIEQNLTGKIDLFASAPLAPGLGRLELDPNGAILASLSTSSVVASKIDMLANGQIDVTAGDGLTLSMTPGKFIINSLLAFDDDAAAGSAGLVSGSVYQTTGLGPAPLNVPGIVMIKQ